MVSFCSLNMFVIPDLMSYFCLSVISGPLTGSFCFWFFFLCIDSPSYLDACLSIFLLLKNVYFRKCILSISVQLIFLATKINQKSHSLIPAWGQTQLPEGGVLDVCLVIRRMIVVLAVWSLLYCPCLWHPTDKFHSLPANCFALNQSPVHRVPYSFIQLILAPWQGSLWS